MFAISAPIITAFSHGRRYSRKPYYPITSDSFIFIETGKHPGSNSCCSLLFLNDLICG